MTGLEKFFFTVGILVTSVGTVFLLFYIIAVFGMVLAQKNRRPPLPRLVLFLLRSYRGMLTPLAKLILGDEHGAEHAAISIINRIDSSRYFKIAPTDKIVVLPQCLRSVECKAKTDAYKGIECVVCGKCVVGRLKKEFPNLRVFITPGGTFAKRIVLTEKPKAVLGVACAVELYEGMVLCYSRQIAVQGLELLRTGCVETAVNEKNLFEIVRGDKGTDV